MLPAPPVPIGCCAQRPFFQQVGQRWRGRVRPRTLGWECTVLLSRAASLREEHGMPLKFGGVATAAAHFDAICDLYDEVFSSPPFLWAPEESLRHQVLLAESLDNPSCSAVVVLDDDRLVGFAYGVTMPPDGQWWQEPPEGPLLPPEPGGTFALATLAVAADRRCRGLGRILLVDLLGGRPEHRAVLTVQTDAVETRIFYRRLGWRPLGVVAGLFGSVAPEWEVMTVGITPFRSLAVGPASGRRSTPGAGKPTGGVGVSAQACPW